VFAKESHRLPYNQQVTAITHTNVRKLQILAGMVLGGTGCLAFAPESPFPPSTAMLDLVPENHVLRGWILSISSLKRKPERLKNPLAHPAKL